MNNKKLFTYINIFCALSILLIELSGCAAMSAQIHHSELSVESKMSNTIFLNPLNRANNKIYVEVKNTATEDLRYLTREIKANLLANNLNVVNDPKDAHNILQVNVLQFGAAKTSEEVWRSINSGYGSVVTGALTGIGVGVLTGSSSWGVGVGLGVAVASWLADEMVQDRAYSMIIDIQVSEQQNDKSWHKYTTRIATVADKVNLKFAEAKPVIVNQIAKEISGIFASDSAN